MSTATAQARRNWLTKIGAYAVLVLFAFIALFPVSRILTISLRPGDRLLSTSLELIPANATLANYVTLLTETDFLRWLLNSSLVALVVTATGVTLASTAGYALSRYKFAGRSAAMSEFLSASRLCAWIAVLIWDLDCQSAVRMSCSCERSCRISPFRS